MCDKDCVRRVYLRWCAHVLTFAMAPWDCSIVYGSAVAKALARVRKGISLEARYALLEHSVPDNLV